MVVFRSDAMLSDDQAQAASDLLWAHWRQGHGWRPCRSRCVPLHGRRAMRSRVGSSGAAKSRCSGGRSRSSRAGQIHIGVDGPLAGRLLAERVYETGSTLPFGANHMRVVEMEFAFRLGRDLPPRETPYLMDEVLDAVDFFTPPSKCRIRAMTISRRWARRSSLPTTPAPRFRARPGDAGALALSGSGAARGEWNDKGADRG